MSNETRNKEELLKSISDLLDETIKEYDGLVKADIRMQPDENGGMAEVAGEAGNDAMKPLKKEEEEAEEKEEEEEKMPEKEEEKKEEEAEEMKKEEEEEEEGKEEEKEKEEEEEKKKKPPFEKKEKEEESKLEKAVEKCLLKLFDRYGFTDGLTKSEKTEEVKESKPKETKKESKGDDRLDKIEKSIASLGETVEKIAKRPAASRRGLDGLSYLRKSEEEVEKTAPSKTEVLDKLVEMQKSGDKKVNTHLITRFEQEGDIRLLEEKGIKI